MNVKYPQLIKKQKKKLKEFDISIETSQGLMLVASKNAEDVLNYKDDIFKSHNMTDEDIILIKNTIKEFIENGNNQEKN